MKNPSSLTKPKRVAVFASFDEENRAEHRRLARLSPAKRLEEFGLLQERAWGTRWTKGRVARTVRLESVEWASK